MKKEIHPKYYEKATVSCACGHKFTVGATQPEIKIEICSKCHPFYTERQEFIDVAGRVERFKTRRVKAAVKSKIKVKKSK